MSVVRKFHEAFGLPAPSGPTIPSDELIRLRMRLIREEYEETMADLGALLRAKTYADKVRLLETTLKELCDLRYVAEGAAVSFGLDIDSAYAQVHASNMSKLGLDGKPIYRDDGKVLKGPGYFEADMSPFVHVVEGSTS